MSPVCVVILNLSGSVMAPILACSENQPAREISETQTQPGSVDVHWRLCNQRSGVCYHKCSQKYLNYKSV